MYLSSYIWIAKKYTYYYVCRGFPVIRFTMMSLHYVTAHLCNLCQSVCVQPTLHPSPSSRHLHSSEFISVQLSWCGSFCPSSFCQFFASPPRCRIFRNRPHLDSHKQQTPVSTCCLVSLYSPGDEEFSSNIKTSHLIPQYCSYLPSAGVWSCGFSCRQQLLLQVVVIVVSAGIWPHAWVALICICRLHASLMSSGWVWHIRLRKEV